MTLRAGAIAAVGVVTCLWAAGCGGSSPGPDAPAAAAKQFVTAVTHDDRGTWCGEVGQALMVAHRSGGLVPRLLSLCKTSDLFEVTASCDREAVVSGSSVTGDSVRGDSADVRLSSGARLGLQRSDGQWYITSISGGSPHSLKQGRCAGAGG